MKESEFDIKKYLKSLKKTLEVKKLESFYVMCDRKDFVPVMSDVRPKDLTDMFASKIQYYKGKRVAHISLYTNPKGLKTGEFVFSIKVTIYKILDNSKLDSYGTNGIRINYKPEDFENRRFYLKDVEKFMRLTADGTLFIDTLNGQWYTTVIKMLKKKGIDFEAD